ncbi:hypothetical protein F0562_032269 [Nyssa sinensis]|uniref:Uncharacterized protein n=1 Tax=Nyssa sinensis TaxID=561372 RepID=A0A5J5AR08_9ASTE|nr:hypothetical protein F0562_032269 [Nyssa sinensis]
MDSKPTLGAEEEALNSHFSNEIMEPGNCEKVGITNVEVNSKGGDDDVAAVRCSRKFGELAICVLVWLCCGAKKGTAAAAHNSSAAAVVSSSSPVHTVGHRFDPSH